MSSAESSRLLESARDEPVSALPPESSAPQQITGTRLRAGNAMGRTRNAVIDGAQRAVEKHGSRKATMADIASLAGVAKATLYNHFRTKRDVYAATVEAEVQALGAECARIAADDGLVAALMRAAERIGTHPAVRRVAADEPAVLAELQTPTTSGTWTVAREAVAATLRVSPGPTGTADVETVLRWLVTFFGAPGGSEELRTGARILAGGLGQSGLGQSGALPGWQRAHQ
jgi:AcrR family transcriptional regulator